MQISALSYSNATIIFLNTCYYRSFKQYFFLIYLIIHFCYLIHHKFNDINLLFYFNAYKIIIAP